METGYDSASMRQKLAQCSVAVAGLGGLGSNVAVMLARAGVGQLFLVDFDRVDESNLNRQYYFLPQIGKYKTDAISEVLAAVNPQTAVSAKCVKVTEQNVLTLFGGFDVVCEAFDCPESKAGLVNCLLEKSKAKIVAASGMAGLEDMNEIRTQHVMRRLYLCGDGESGTNAGDMFAPRVTACAAHQANVVLRLLLDMETK